MGKRKPKAKPANNGPTLAYAIAHPDAESGIYHRGTIDLTGNLSLVPPANRVAVRHMIQKQLDQWRTNLPGTLDLARKVALELIQQTSVEAHNEASEILARIAEMRAVKDTDAKRLVMQGYALGRLLELVGVLVFERNAKAAAPSRKPHRWGARHEKYWTRNNNESPRENANFSSLKVSLRPTPITSSPSHTE